jgi:hypothetical protein
VQTRYLVFAILALSCIHAPAGYTHYYTWKQPPDDASLKACVADMNRLIEARKSILVSPDLRESIPGSVNLSPTNVDFNGIGNHACEPFVFPFVFPEHSSFNFCKTRGEPYDQVVTACLLVARDHFPPSTLEIKSDGEWEDWKEGAILYSSVFGRPARNPMIAHGITGASPGSIRFNLAISVVVIAVVLLGVFFWQKRAGNPSKAWRQSFK